MLINLLLKGALIGFSIAMPVGPIGLLCIQNSLSKGKKHGLMTGLGAATADALFGAMAGFGVATLTNFLIDYKFIFQFFASFFLCFLGIMTLKKNRSIKSQTFYPKSSIHAFFTTFFLTLTNPLTILSFLGIFAALEIGVEDRLDSMFFLTIGVFLGSTCWWVILSTGAAFFKHKFNTSISLWLNRFSGAILIVFGILTFFL